MFAALLDRLSLGTPAGHGQLTLTPVLLRGAPLSPVEPMALEDALAARLLEVTEISSSGSVPDLQVQSTAEVPVLILDGEELVGAKQNRIVNVTILVPPKARIIIPVSCIEAGRWSYSRPSFAAAGRVLNHEVRASKSASVTRSLKRGSAHYSDQREVWATVDSSLSKLGTDSPTRALSDGYTSRGLDIEAYLEAFKGEATQVGVLYRISGVLAGLDLFGTERSFARAFPKLLRGSALQALAGYTPDAAPRLDEAQLLEKALASSAESFPGVGLGEDLRLDTPEVGGGALRLDGGLVHLFAFARATESGLVAA